MSIIADCYKDGEAVINDRRYVFGDVDHEFRLAIVGYFYSIRETLVKGSYEFVSTSEFKEIETKLLQNITFNDESLFKLKDKKHFEEFGEDYFTLITTAIQVFSYPFLKGVL